MKKDLDFTSVPQNSHASAILIDADNVNLNFKGYCLSGVNAKEKTNPFTTLKGVEIVSGRNKIKIKNPCVAGFKYGVELDQNEQSFRSSSVSVSNGWFKNNSFRGIRIAADQVLIENNVVENTGGDLSFGRDTYSMGIAVRGINCTIMHNKIFNTWPTNSGEGVGISISSQGNGCKIESNHIQNDGFSLAGRTFGIWVDGSQKKPIALLQKNKIINFSYAMSKGQTEISNYIQDENCNYNKILGIAASGAGEYTAHFHRFCIDDLEDANRSLDIANINSLFRVAQIYYDKELYEQSYIYFSIASELGSEEASRRTKIMQTLKFIPPQKIKDMETAIQKEKKRLSTQHLISKI